MTIQPENHTSAASAPIPCPVCYVGRLHARRVTFARLYGNTLIHIPNAPAQVCDVCALTIPDENAIARIETLLGHTGPPPNHHRPRSTAVPGEDLSAQDPAPPEPRPQRKS